MMLDQESDFYLRNLNILITCLLDISMDILGRSFMLITSGRLRAKCSSAHPSEWG